MKEKFKQAALEYEAKDGKGSMGAALAWAFYRVLCEGYKLTDLDEFCLCPCYTGNLSKEKINERKELYAIYEEKHSELR